MLRIFSAYALFIKKNSVISTIEKKETLRNGIEINKKWTANVELYKKENNDKLINYITYFKLQF